MRSAHAADPLTVDAFLAGRPFLRAVFERVHQSLEARGRIEVRVSKSQIAFRRRRGLAYLWRPGQYLAHPVAEVVLSIALGRHDGSARWKEVVHPARAHWMHHLEIHQLADIDAEVEAWLGEAFGHAG